MKRAGWVTAGAVCLGLGLVSFGVFSDRSSYQLFANTPSRLEFNPPVAAVQVDAGDVMQQPNPDLDLTRLLEEDSAGSKALKFDLKVSAPGYADAIIPKGPVTSGVTREGTLSVTWLTWLLRHGVLFLSLPFFAMAWKSRPPEPEALEPQEEQQRVAVGGLLGEYRLERVLGKGAQSEVFVGSSASGEKVAIKVIAAHLDDEEWQQRFEREATLCQSLTHPNIVRVHYVGFSLGRWWMVQDLLTGGSLRDMLSGPLPTAKVRTLLGQVANALAYAHGKGVIHRDLKPENIFVSSKGEAILGDFGLARSARYQTITKTDATLGTPAYMPPEQVQGERPDHRADLYSLGIIAYEMLTGKVPFGGDIMTTLLAQMTQAPPPLPESLPADLRELTMQLLEKSPDRRPANAQEVASRISAAT